MTLRSDIMAATQAAQDALAAKMASPGFEQAADRIAVSWQGLMGAGEAFVASHAPGDAGLLDQVERAYAAAAAMTAGTVASALGIVDAAAAALTRAAGDRGAGGFFKLRGALSMAKRAPVAQATRAPAARSTDYSARSSLPPFAEANMMGFRVDAGPPAGASPTPRAPTPPTSGAAGDPNYYQKLTNLFPAEALALYGTGVALFGGANLFVVFAVLAVLVTLRWFATQPSGGGTPDVVAIAVAVVAYLLWATATDPAWLGGIAAAGDLDTIRRGAGFLGAIVVVIAPLVVKPAPVA